jgi:hypothetical protein
MVRAIFHSISLLFIGAAVSAAQNPTTLRLEVTVELNAAVESVSLPYKEKLTRQEKTGRKVTVMVEETKKLPPSPPEPPGRRGGIIQALENGGLGDDGWKVKETRPDGTRVLTRNVPQEIDEVRTVDLGGEGQATFNLTVQATIINDKVTLAPSATLRTTVPAGLESYNPPFRAKVETEIRAALKVLKETSIQLTEADLTLLSSGENAVIDKPVSFSFFGPQKIAVRIRATKKRVIRGSVG